MKCPRCHGTGKVRNRTRYRVEVGDSHQWYKISMFNRGSTTNLRQAKRDYLAVNLSDENKATSRTDDYLLVKVRMISISAKGRRRTLLERGL